MNRKSLLEALLPRPRSTSQSRQLEFQAFGWEARDELVTISDFNSNGSQKKKALVMRIFGTMLDGRSIALAVHGFRPHFYIKLEPQWTKDDVDSLRHYITHKARTGIAHMVKLACKDFYGFRNGQAEYFLRVDFYSHSSMKYFANKELAERFKIGKHVIEEGQLKIYESNIEPQLRFMHDRDLSPSGWMQVKSEHLELDVPDDGHGTDDDDEEVDDVDDDENSNNKSTRCAVSYKTNWKNVNPLVSSIGNLISNSDL